MSLTVARDTLERAPLPGDVFLLNWPRLGVDQMVVRVTGIDTGTLGASGGTAAHTLTTPQIPAHTHNTGTTIGSRNTSAGGGETIVYAGATYTGTATGGGQAHPNVQPTLVTNYIIKT